MPRQTGVFGHDGRRLIGSNDKYVQWECVVGSFRSELSLLPRKIESSVRVVDEHSPTGCPDQPGNGHTRTMCPQFVAALAIMRVVHESMAVELWSTFSKCEQRRRPGFKRNYSMVLYSYLLDWSALSSRDGEGQRVRRNS